MQGKTEEEWFSQGCQRNRQKTCKVDLENYDENKLPLYPPTDLPSDPMILKAFLKLFEQKWCLLNAQQKKERKKKQCK